MTSCAFVGIIGPCGRIFWRCEDITSSSASMVPPVRHADPLFVDVFRIIIVLLRLSEVVTRLGVLARLSRLDMG